MSETKENSPKLEEEEDVPSDFFDDFLNNDFMDGLDVVDAWDDDNDKTVKPADKPPKSSKNKRRRSPVRAKSRDRSPRGSRYKTRRSRERPFTERKKRSTSRSKLQEDPVVDHRRDPEKTRRDIQKDKDKCAKDHEDKIISEKLKMVETGLVPPGTEMEAIIEFPKLEPKSKPSEKNKKEVSDKHSKKERSTDRSRRYKRSRSRSPYRRRSRSRSPKYSRRISKERRRYSERSPKKYGSPNTTAKNTRADSPFSDREMWIRNETKRVTAADFFVSQRRNFTDKFIPSYNPTAERLHDPSHFHMAPPAPVPIPVPVPAPAPIPDYFSQPLPIQVSSEQNYDQSFFIGQQFTEVYPTPTTYQNPPAFVPQSNVVTVPIVESHQPVITATTTKTFESPKNEVYNEKETITKLFEDKKISLSDFLTVSAKYADPSQPINVQKKIKVISLCQDAIKALSENSMLHGRFFYKKVKKEAEKPVDAKHQSPLRKSPFIRFAFTTPCKTVEEPSTMQNSLNKLLGSLGLLEEAPLLFTNASYNITMEDVKPIVPPPFEPSPVKRTSIIGKGGDSTFKIPPRKAKMCQTDFAKCQMCEIRKARTFVDKEVQCEVSYSTFGTQVQEEDFVRLGVKTPLKNQSIAHLTPAQLMRQSEGKQSGNFVPARGLPPDVSPENSNIYRGDNMNITTDFPKSSPTFNNPHFEGRSNNRFDFFGTTRPKFNKKNMNRQNMNITPVRGNAPMKAADFFEGGRQNFGNNFVGGRQNQGNNFATGRQNQGNNFDVGCQIQGSIFDSVRQNQDNSFDGGRQNQDNSFDGGNNFDEERQNLGNNFDGGHQNLGSNFDGGRQNYGNNPIPQLQQQMHKRTLLPNPNFKRNY